MVLHSKAGSFTRPGAGTANTVVTGLGFSPSVVIFLASHAVTAGTWRAALQTAIGWAAKIGGDTSAIGQASGSISANNGAAPASYVAVQGKVTLRDSAGSVQAEAASVAFNADGFTIDWTNSPYDGDQELVVYLALGGDAQAAANAYLFTATELLAETPSRFHGLHFSPDAALVLAQDASGTAAQSFGVAANTQWALGLAAQSGANPSNTWRRLSDQGAIELLNPATGVRSFAASLAMSRSGMALSPLGNVAIGSLGSGDDNLSSPQNVALTSGGDIYVADYGNHRIKRHAPDGSFVSEITVGDPSSTMRNPRDVAVDASGNVYAIHDVASAADRKISKWNSSHVYQDSISLPLFPAPINLATDNTYLYVTVGTSVRKYNCSTLAFVASWGSAGSGDGQFSGLAYGVAADGSYVYVSDYGGNRVQKFTTSGVFVTKWGAPGSGPGQFGTLAGLSCDGSGHVWVADFQNLRAQKFTDTGTWVQSLPFSAGPNGVAAVAATVVVSLPSRHQVLVTSLPTHDVDLRVLYLGNVIATAGIAAKSTDGAPAAQNIATGFRPRAALFCTHADTLLNTSASHLRFGVGVSDGTTGGTILGQAQDNVATANTDTLTLTNRAIAKADNTTPAVDASATAAFSGQNIVLTWDPNDGARDPLVIQRHVSAAHEAAHAAIVLASPGWGPVALALVIGQDDDGTHFVETDIGRRVVASMGDLPALLGHSPMAPADCPASGKEREAWALTAGAIAWAGVLGGNEWLRLNHLPPRPQRIEHSPGDRAAFAQALAASGTPEKELAEKARREARRLLHEHRAQWQALTEHLLTRRWLGIREVRAIWETGDPDGAVNLSERELAGLADEPAMLRRYKIPKSLWPVEYLVSDLLIAPAAA